jgi:hypothetical protein
MKIHLTFPSHYSHTLIRSDQMFAVSRQKCTENSVGIPGKKKHLKKKRFDLWVTFTARPESENDNYPVLSRNSFTFSTHPFVPLVELSPCVAVLSIALALLGWSSCCLLVGRFLWSLVGTFLIFSLLFDLYHCVFVRYMCA